MALTVVGGPLSLLPPIVTLAAAVTLRQTFVAMLFGIWSGAVLLNGVNPLIALLRTFDHYIIRSLADPEHAGVLLFTAVLGGTIGLVQKSGGALGLAGLVKGFFTTRRRGALSTIGLGSLVFFDDYSSILIVGNSLRPLLKAVRLSAQKLAYIAHTVGVVLAALSPLSSWVGIQIGYIAGAYQQLGGEAVLGAASADPFLAFLTTTQFKFFPLSMLAFVVLGAVTGRDFGPMLMAEREASPTAAPTPPPTTRTRTRTRTSAATARSIPRRARHFARATPCCPLAPSSSPRSVGWSGRAGARSARCPRRRGRRRPSSTPYATRTRSRRSCGAPSRGGSR